MCVIFKNWGQEEKRVAEDEMAGWHHWLNGHEFNLNFIMAAIIVYAWVWILQTCEFAREEHAIFLNRMQTIFGEIAEDKWKGKLCTCP